MRGQEQVLDKLLGDRRASPQPAPSFDFLENFCQLEPIDTTVFVNRPSSAAMTARCTWIGMFSSGTNICTGLY